MSDQRRATLYALAAVLAWSTVATAFKLSLRHLAPSELLLHACVVSLLFLAGAVTVQGKWPLLRGATTRQLLLAAGLGIINPFVYYLVLFAAYDRLPAQVAQPVNFTWALVLTYLSVPLLKQRLHWRDIVAGVICYGGVFVITSGGRLGLFAGADPLGLALALISTVFWALYWIGNTRNRLDPVVGLLVNFACALPLVLIAAAISPGLRLPSLAGWLGAAYVGIFEMGLTFVLWLSALRLTDSTSRIANLIFLAPFLSLIFINFVLGERVRGATLIGLVLIVVGLLLQGRRSSSTTGPKQ